MNTKRIFQLILFTLVFSSFCLQAQNSKEWLLHKESNGIQIFYKYTDCNIPSEGVYKEMVLLKFVNTTQLPLKIRWQREAWYEGKCSSCGSDEYKFVLEIPAGETIVGECDIYAPSKLKIFSKFLDLKSSVHLEKFNLDILEVSPY